MSFPRLRLLPHTYLRVRAYERRRDPHMSSVDPDLHDVQDDDPRGLRDFAERANREASEAKSELADLRRREAFRDAGLDPTNPVHAAVVKGYDGDLDGVKEFVTGLGLTNSAPPPVPTDEQDALNRIANIPTGDGGSDPNPDADGNARLKAISDQAVREKWPRYRFDQEFTAEMERQRRPVQTMDIHD